MSVSEAMKGNQNGRKYHVSRETIERLYLDEKRTVAEIEEILGYPGVYREICRLGIPRRDCRKKPEAEPSLSDIAYAAGFFDGEGSINIKKPTRTCGYRLVVSATQTIITPIEWFRVRWGGSIRTKTETTKRKVAWEWTVTSQLALEFLKNVRPFLLVKGEQADIAIEFQSRKFNGIRNTAERLAFDDDSRHRLMLLR